MRTEGTTVFDLGALLAEQRESGEPWLEFLRVPSLRTGLYVLAAGAWDSQSPHEEDEVYYVIRGKATFQAGDERWPVTGGAIIFVPSHQEHRFTEIAEEVTILVFFAASRPQAASG